MERGLHLATAKPKPGGHPLQIPDPPREGRAKKIISNQTQIQIKSQGHGENPSERPSLVAVRLGVKSRNIVGFIFFFSTVF